MPSVVGVTAVPDARRAHDDGAAALSADPAAGGPVGAHGALPCRARSRALALAPAILQLSLGGDRQPWRRPARDPARQAVGPRAGGEVDRDRDSAAHRRGFPVGGKRSARANSADGLLRAPLHLRLSVPVRVRELRALGRFCLPGVRALAEAWASRTNGRPRVAVRSDLARGLLHPHLWVGACSG